MQNNQNKSSGGYKNLAFFRQTEIIYDFTMEFCARYINYKSRTKDQMEQAARSGKQNISEGYAQLNERGKDKLLRVARGSLEELLQDYQDFLRQKELFLWDKDDPRAKEVRNLVYKIKDNKDYNLYKGYLCDPEAAANAMICLINQTNMMLNQKIRWLEENQTQEKNFSPREKWLDRQMEKERTKAAGFQENLKEETRRRGLVFTRLGFMDAEKARQLGLEEIETS